MPRYRLREVDHLAVAADPMHTFSIVRSTDLYRVPFVRRLFALRLVPERVTGWLRGQPSSPMPTSARIEEITAPGTGFHLLAENDSEIVVGSIGKFWQPKIDFADITPATFATFDESGWGKLAWSLAVAPRERGSWITIDLRVDAWGAESWAKFARYWYLIGRFSRAIRRGLLSFYGDELRRSLPDKKRHLGDEDLLQDVRFQRTHSVDIEAPPARLWPWLVQMGCQRAGWYSWDRLDNAGVPSANRIIPALQQIVVGDILPARPTGPDGFAVLRVQPGRALTLGSPSLMPAGKAGKSWNTPYDVTWTFVLEPIGTDATHLVVRVRAAYRPSARMALLRPALSAIHEIMERKQLRTLKQRAEA